MPLSQLPILNGSPSLPSGAMPKTSGLAITSMVLGICSFLCGGFPAIPAIICGHIAHSKIQNSQGQQTGVGFAIAGFITGYIGIFVMIAMLAGLTAPTVIRQRKKSRPNDSGEQRPPDRTRPYGV